MNKLYGIQIEIASVRGSSIRYPHYMYMILGEVLKKIIHERKTILRVQ